MGFSLNKQIAGASASNAPNSASFVTTAVEAGLTSEKVLGTSVNMSGTLGAIPAFGISGRTYFATDDNGGTLYRDTGAAWVQTSLGLSTTGAPTNASYVTTAAEGGLSNEKVLGTAINMAGAIGAIPAFGTAGRTYLATDLNGGTLYRDNGAAWVQAAAEVNVTAGGLTTVQVVKPADEIKFGTPIGSAELADDADLTFAIGAGETWIFEFIVFVDSTINDVPNTADRIQFGFSYPNAAEIVYGVSSVAGYSTTDIGEGQLFKTNESATQSMILVWYRGHQEWYHLKGSIINGANAGNVTFQWTGYGNSGLALAIKAGSYLKAIRS